MCDRHTGYMRLCGSTKFLPLSEQFLCWPTLAPIYHLDHVDSSIPFEHLDTAFPALRSFLLGLLSELEPEIKDRKRHVMSHDMKEHDQFLNNWRMLRSHPFSSQRPQDMKRHDMKEH